MKREGEKRKIRQTIRRRKDGSEVVYLEDGQKYDILRRYRAGEAALSIANSYNISEEQLRNFISTEIKSLNTIQETNKLIQEQQGLPMRAQRNPSELMNERFLQEVPDRIDAYLYYFAITGSNIHALKHSGLDSFLPAKIPEETKRYALSIRGHYLRSLPGSADLVNQLRDQKLRDANIEKPYVQSELIDQIEQMKELSIDDPKNYRGHMLKAIELLGKTIGAFQENIRVEEVSTKSGLDLLMEKCRSEVYEYSGESEDDGSGEVQ
jgi:hypothetical protein